MLTICGKQADGIKEIRLKQRAKTQDFADKHMEREERYSAALAEASDAGIALYGPAAAAEDRHLWAVRSPHPLLFLRIAFW